jgi:hypothetical protein
VKPAIAGSDLMKETAPKLLTGEGATLLASEDRVMDLAFLAKQNLEPSALAVQLCSPVPVSLLTMFYIYRNIVQ